MEQLIEFVGNHPLLSGGLIAAVLVLIWTEGSRRIKGIPELTPAQAVSWINQNQCTVVDVSSTADFDKGHIVDARNIVPSRLATADAEITKILSQAILVVDKNGQSAAAAASGLKKLGAENIVTLKGGMAQWQSDQYPVTSK
jgi:rhodanese-related sulfurtransferase